ncbi:uncharacterized protein LOC125709402 isoform X2 [Brienomyrus brachyistius]|uniref:uncharacterized protein LOC125709402 isoform X2 n=1 Tax=Brienomyrus brachyistius TaxID=42636 RepID=UPI0020B2A939|nr:uncharacterized protein LOC125709402 isoform X2 [Brienomyrus brachyistius]
MDTRQVPTESQGTSWAPNRGEGTSWAPARGQRMSWAPARGQGMSREPARGQGTSWDPARGQGTSWEPARGQRRSWEPARGQGTSWEPARGQGTSWEPARGQGMSWAPARGQERGLWTSSASMVKKQTQNTARCGTRRYPADVVFVEGIIKAETRPRLGERDDTLPPHYRSLKEPVPVAPVLMENTSHSKPMFADFSNTLHVSKPVPMVQSAAVAEEGIIKAETRPRLGERDDTLPPHYRTLKDPVPVAPVLMENTVKSTGNNIRSHLYDSSG